MKQCPGTYFVIVIEDVNKSQVIGTATLVVEQKFIHDAAVVSLFLSLQFNVSFVFVVFEFLW